jgi:hypothetical protein
MSARPGRIVARVVAVLDVVCAGLMLAAVVTERHAKPGSSGRDPLHRDGKGQKQSNQKAEPAHQKILPQ